MSIDVKQILKNRFAAPLKENYRRRIIFWQDPDGEFADLVDEYCPEGVKLLKLTGTNHFAAKQLLSETDTESDYLVYNPLSYADIRDNWLLDIELYSEEFRADLLSMRMQELGMEPTSQLRKTMKAYSRFFENKERVAKLTGFKSDYTNPGVLHIDVLAVLAGTSDHTPAGVIRALLAAGLDSDENAALANIRKFGNESVLWEMVNRYTGYAHDAEQPSLLPLASWILLTALSVTIKTSCLSGLEKWISEPHRQRCYDLVNEWLQGSEDAGYYEIARAVEEQHRLVERFDALDVKELLGSECFPCLNECILRHYFAEIADGVVKAEEIAEAAERRRTLKWYGHFRDYYESLLQIAQMQRFYQANISGFHIAEHEKLWKEYCVNYCRMDHYYRLFHAAFARSLKESTTRLEDYYKSAAEYVEKLYKNWYLGTLGAQWTKLVAGELARNQRLEGIRNQEDFYKYCVKPIVRSGSRAFVIISDALRYEVGAELRNDLLRETKGEAKISSLQSVFPSATKYGMAALLPHQALQLTDDMKVLCDGEATEGTAARDKILKLAQAGNVAVTAKALLAMKQAERRELVSQAQVVYIYHNTIDAVGEKVATEDQVCEACEQAIREIKNLVRLIVNDMNGTNVLITADHGFLYSYMPLEESDKAEKGLLSGGIRELDRRYAITDGDCQSEHLLRIPMTRYGSPLLGFAPRDQIRLKKPGGGMNYVHGGISLQEMVVPVVEFHNLRAASKQFVDVRKAELSLLSQSRKVSNSIFSLEFYQKEPIGGKVTKATYEIYMADAAGKAVSDKKTVIADKTSTNEQDRVIRTRFTLKSVEFRKTDTYYLTIVEKDGQGIVDQIEFTIDIAFVNDFDF